MPEFRTPRALANRGFAAGAAGVSAMGVGYVAAVVLGSQLLVRGSARAVENPFSVERDRVAARRLFIPVIGPYAAAGQLYTPPQVGMTLGIGTLQIAGLGLAIWGFIRYRKQSRFVPSPSVSDESEFESPRIVHAIDAMAVGYGFYALGTIATVAYGWAFLDRRDAWTLAVPISAPFLARVALDEQPPVVVTVWLGVSAIRALGFAAGTAGAVVYLHERKLERRGRATLSFGPGSAILRF